MSVNRVSTVMNQTDIDEVLKSIKTIQEKMPFMVPLTTDERMAMPRFSPKHIEFYKRAYDLAVQNPGFLPRDFDLDEMKKDVELRDQLQSIIQNLQILLEHVEDTGKTAGAEAYAAGLEIYRYAKNSSINTGGLEDVLDIIGKVFTKRARKTTPPAK